MYDVAEYENHKIIAVVATWDETIAVEYSPWLRHGGGLAVVRLLFVVIILKALVCLLPVKNGQNNVGISTISFSGLSRNPAGFAQNLVG